MASTPLTAEQARWPRMIGAATNWRAALRAGLAAAYAAARGTQQAAQAVTNPIKEGVQAGAVAVAESAITVASVPADTARAVRRELDEWWARVSASAAEAAILGVLALFGLILLSLGAVVLLNATLGDPYGTLLVGLLYATGAAIVLGRRKARAARERTRAAAREPTVHAVEPAAPPPTPGAPTAGPSGAHPAPTPEP